MSEQNKPMADYVKLPKLEEYAEWFKKVEAGEVENPFAIKPVTPYRPKPVNK